MARADSTADLEVTIDVNTKKGEEGFKKAAQATKGFSSKVKGISAGIIGADVLTKAAQGMWEFGKKSVEAYANSQKNAVMYTDAMKRIPGASDAATKALGDQATALGKVTTFSKGTVKQGQAVLAGFGLTEKQLKELTPLMLDYATKTGSDLPTAAKQLGRALMGQGRSLKNVGIDFVDTGSLQGNFDELTRELTKHVGGLATEMGQTAPGQMEIMKNQIKGLVVAFGAQLYPALLKVVGMLADLVKWIQANSSWLIPLAQDILKVAAAFLALQTALKLVALARKAMAAIKGGWVTVAIVGAIALVTAIKRLYDQWDWFHKAVDAVWQALQVAWDATVGAIVAGVKGIIVAVQWIWDKFDWVFKDIWKIVQKYTQLITLPIRIMMDLIKAIFKGDWDAVLNIFKGIPGRVIGALGGLFSAITAPFKKAVDWVIGIIPGLWSWVSGVAGKIASGLSGVWDAITSPFRRAADTIRSIIGGVVDWVSGQFNRIKGFATDAINFVKGIYNTFARGWNAIEVKMPEIDTHIPGIGKVGGFTVGLPDLPIFAKGAYATGPTLGVFGDQGAEWVLPEAKLEALLRRVGAGNGSPARTAPAVVLEHATFATEVDLDAFLRRAAWTVRTQGI